MPLTSTKYNTYELAVVVVNGLISHVMVSQSTTRHTYCSHWSYVSAIYYH